MALPRSQWFPTLGVGELGKAVTVFESVSPFVVGLETQMECMKVFWSLEDHE